MIMKKQINELMGRQIKKCREDARLTQEELAEILECTPQYISLLENGRYGISVKMLRTLCLALNISSDSILFPGQVKNDLTVMNGRCEALNEAQFRFLVEIIDRYIQAVTLEGDP